MKLRSLARLMVLTLAASGLPDARAGLVSQWNFDETSGTVVHDSVGSNNGTLSGGAAFAPGQGIDGSGALSLNASTDSYATFGKIFPLTSGSYSMVVWEETTVTTGQFVLSEHHTGYLNGYFVATGNVGDGSGSNNHLYQSGSFFGSPTNVEDGQWHQLAFVYNAGGSTQYYVDGTLQATGSGSTIIANDAAFMLGGVDASGTPTGEFTGLISDVSVYNNALTGSQISSLYNNPFSVPEPASLATMAIGLAGAVVLRRRLK